MLIEPKADLSRSLQAAANRIAKLESKLSTVQNDLIDAQVSADTLRTRAEALERRCEALQTRLEEATKWRDAAIARADETRSQLASEMVGLDAANLLLNGYREREANFETRLDNADKIMEAQSVAYRGVNDMLNEARSRLDTVRSMCEQAAVNHHTTDLRAEFAVHLLERVFGVERQESK